MSNLWLWIWSLGDEPYNHWLEAGGLDLRLASKDLDLTITYDSLHLRVLGLVYNGKPADCSLFFEPQLEYYLRESLFTSYTQISQETYRIGINFTEAVMIYSGSP